MMLPFNAKKWFSLFASCILTLAMVLLGLSIGDILLAPASFRFLGISADSLFPYLSFLGVWFVFLVFAAVSKDKETLHCLGARSAGNSCLFIFWGLLLGTLLNSICAFSALLHKDIVLSCSFINIPAFLLLFLSILVQSGAEELACRVFLYRSVLRNSELPLMAVLVNSLLFGLMHLTNSGVTVAGIFNSVFFGIFLSLFIFYWDSFWCVTCIHASWNFTQNIIFGLPNSGHPSPFSIFHLDAVKAENSFFYSPTFGLEGTYFSCIVLAFAAVFLFFFGRKYTGKNIEAKNKIY